MQNAGLSALGEWTHVHCDNPMSQEYIHDSMLLKLIKPAPPASVVAGKSLLEVCLMAKDSVDEEVDDYGKIAFVFEKISNPEPESPKEDEGADE